MKFPSCSTLGLLLAALATLSVAASAKDGRSLAAVIEASREARSLASYPDESLCPYWLCGGSVCGSQIPELACDIISSPYFPPGGGGGGGGWGYGGGGGWGYGYGGGYGMSCSGPDLQHLTCVYYGSPPHH